MPLSELRHASGIQKASRATLSAAALIPTTNARIVSVIAVALMRDTRAADTIVHALSIATTTARTLKVTRKSALSNSGPTGNTRTRQRIAATVTPARTTVSV